jgi:TonB family protein
MYFDFDDDRPDIKPVGSALSWYVRALGSVAAHVVALLSLLVGERVVSNAAVAPVPPAREAAVPPGKTHWVFVEPRVDVPAPKPPPRAPLSDENRVARTQERAPKPENPLPLSKGNTWEQVERRDDPARGKPDAAEAPPSDSPEQRAQLEPPAPDDRNRQVLPDSQSARLTLPPSSEAPSRGGSGLPRGALGDALRNLDRYVQTDQFENPRGGDAPFGSAIQFNTYGVDFGRWIRRFKAQVEGNWGPLIPQAIMWNQGHVVITFNVHKDGRITDIDVVAPSHVQGFNAAAHGAISASNPTTPLPPEYPIGKAFFTVTFYYNERPPN